jgi:hypothetical protein
VSVNGTAPPGRPARLALGALGLVLLFGLGYRISLHRLRAPAGDVSAQ